jgi:hypothetical protein
VANRSVLQFPGSEIGVYVEKCAHFAAGSIKSGEQNAVSFIKYAKSGRISQLIL